MKGILKTITGMAALLLLFAMVLHVFGKNPVYTKEADLITVLAAGVPMEEEERLLPYRQQQSLFSDMDMQYAFLILQQGLERSFLKDHAELSLVDGNNFLIRCWSEGAGFDITEGLADNETRLAEWDNAVNTLWELDAVLSRDIKETLGTDKSVTIQIVDEGNRDAVLLCIKDGSIEYNLFRDGVSPKYEVYGR